MDLESFSLPWVMEEDMDSLRRRVYYAARDGFAITLYALLSNTSKTEWCHYLEHPVEDEGHKCTPLLIAAINGHDHVIKMLLNRFSPNIEQDGIVQIDGYIIEGATALWCAAGAGHFSVVKYLLSHGADVNHPTKTNSTPLRAACFDGRFDVIQYLVENGADIHKANKYNNTCLMLAAYRGHADVVEYLLSKNTDPDAKAQCGATALHFAAEHGRLEIIKKLLKSGASVTKNKMGMTPLLSAAERSKAEVVEYFIKKSWCSKEEAIEALELLGASFANDKDFYNLEKAYYYLHWAMLERECNPDLSQKALFPPILAYDDHIECRNMAELEAIKYNSNALHMESLVIRERILGSNNPEVPHPVVFRGALFADVGRFDRCVDLWLHALNLRYTYNVKIQKDLLRFAQVFCQMMHTGVEVSFDKVYQVLNVTLQELIRNKTALNSSSESESHESLMEELEDNIYTTLYLLVIVTKLLKKLTTEEEQCLYKLVYKINKLNLTTIEGLTLLHLAVNADTPVDEFHTKNVCKFPCAATAGMLIQCGADVNAVDRDGNTPLHIIVAYQKPITDFMTLHSIITKLLEAGSHIDRVNHEGESPFDAVLTGVAEIILKSQYQLSLKCIAAKAVKKYNLPYKGVVPLTLANFTDMHGSVKKKRVK